MEGIYSLMDVLLPFPSLQFSFMKNAFLAVLLLTPLKLHLKMELHNN